MGMLVNPARFGGGEVVDEVTSDRWRLLVVTGNSGNWVNFGEVHFWDTPNVTQEVGGTPSVSSNTGFASAIFDGNKTSTFWESAFGDVVGAWVEYAFPAPVACSLVEVTNGNYGGEAPNTFDVQYWDGSAWVTKWTVSGETAWPSYQTRIFADPTRVAPAIDVDGPNQWFRLRSRTTDTDSVFMGYSEIEAAASEAGADLTQASEAFSNRAADGVANPANAFDNDVGTYWEGSSTPARYATPTAFIGCKLSSAAHITELRLVGSPVSVFTPRDFDVEVSPNGYDYATSWSISADPWSASEARTYTKP